MQSEEILVVEDEPTVADVVARYLRRDGYGVTLVGDGNAALKAYERRKPDLIILDLMLPGLDGLEVCRRIRSAGEAPIIMVTARTEAIDKLVGFGLGADDYVTKPFSPQELVARVRAVLKRSGPQKSRNSLRFIDLTIDRGARTVENLRGAVSLTALEFDLLLYLASNPSQVFSRENLLDAVWDYDFPGDASTVTVHMRRLRAKVESDPSRPRHLKTVWGVGYKFEP